MLSEDRGSGEKGFEIGGEPMVLGKKKTIGKQWAAQMEDYIEVDAPENHETMPRQGWQPAIEESTPVHAMVK